VIDIGDNNGNPCSGVIIQDGSTLSSDGELWVGQTANGLGSYTLNSGTIALRNWLAVGRAGGNGTFNMTGGTFIKSGNGNFIIGTGAGNNTSPVLATSTTAPARSIARTNTGSVKIPWITAPTTSVARPWSTGTTGYPSDAADMVSSTSLAAPSPGRAVVRPLSSATLLAVLAMAT